MGNTFDSPNSSQGIPGFEHEAKVLGTVIAAMQSMDADARERVLRTVATFFGLEPRHTQTATAASKPGSSAPPFSQERTISAKEFLKEKMPISDVERVTCLAYYLTHYANTPHFKTLDLSKLNTEAAQIKFSNAAQAVDNATKAGFLAAASKGTKQISYLGESYVQALPDRNAARAAVAHARPKRNRRKGRPSNSASIIDTSQDNI